MFFPGAGRVCPQIFELGSVWTRVALRSQCEAMRCRPRTAPHVFYFVVRLHHPKNRKAQISVKMHRAVKMVSRVVKMAAFICIIYVAAAGGLGSTNFTA